MDRLQASRFSDFQRRLEFAPHTIYPHITAGWKDIPIHPFADEPDELARLNLRPEDCLCADAWWGIDGNATLLQVWALSIAGRVPGFYARVTEDDEAWCYLMAVLKAPHVTRSSLESAMSQFAELGFPFDSRFHLPVGSRLTLLARA